MDDSIRSAGPCEQQQYTPEQHAGTLEWLIKQAWVLMADPSSGQLVLLPVVRFGYAPGEGHPVLQKWSRIGAQFVDGEGECCTYLVTRCFVLGVIG